MYIPILSFIIYKAACQRITTAPAPSYLFSLPVCSSDTLWIHRSPLYISLGAENAKGKPSLFIPLHGNHHHYPRDRQRLFMPPVPSLLISSSLFGLMYRNGQLVFMFFPGFLLGYLMYGTMHYAIHAWNPPFKWMKPLWRNHHLHHYKNEHNGYGVKLHFVGSCIRYHVRPEERKKRKIREGAGIDVREEETLNPLKGL